MNVLEMGEGVIKNHAPLIQRVSTIADSLFRGANIVLRDAADTSPLPPRARVVTLARGDEPQLLRNGPNHVTITYRDPNSESALSKVIAAMARPEDPLAADPESLSIFALGDRLAASDIPVLINGPTGTGKEVLARFIHARSDRRDAPFVAVNCAAMPDTMLEAMLFGHQKGAFTGATQSNEGFFRAADGGTLLLDEIAEMPLGLQAKLLRALQEGEVVPIGSTKAVKVDVRVIACANRDLPTEVAEGRFRADLYYRLNVFPLMTRPLCERPDDIAPLAFALAMRHSTEDRLPWFTDAAMAMLKLHSWPGNVRELENVIRRALLLAHGKPAIEAEHIIFDSPARLVQSQPMPSHPVSATVAEPAAGRKLSNIVQISEARAIMETLEACGGNRGEAARQLGISERTLRYRLASFREAGLAVAGGRR
ncbi:MAG: sigma-54-dependent Fis family transcriptional regulator [Novosphingobium sp.]|nr:sigma-54-dependent Fis family transcriptional regulator [Novosphingobium sp.]MCP5401075.1 sigma-54-dependent Fis family transcriptional regulator [Novosphingobium sp.]